MDGKTIVVKWIGSGTLTEKHFPLIEAIDAAIAQARAEERDKKPTLHFFEFKKDPTRGDIVLLWVKRDDWEDYRMILDLERSRARTQP